MKIKKIMLVGLITTLLNLTFLCGTSIGTPDTIDPEPWLIEVTNK